MSDAPSIQNFLYLCRDFAERTGKTGRLTVQHRGEVSLVLDQTPSLRRIHTLRGAEYWIPRKTVANAALRESESLARKSFRRRQKPLWNQPCWTGEARPDTIGVPLSDISRTLRQDEIEKFYYEFGLPIRFLVVLGSLPRPIRDPEPRKTRKELGEIVVVQTPFHAMPPEQREQKKDHNQLMRILSTMRMGSGRESAVYGVIILGKSVREVAESRGLNAASLSVTISKVRAKMN